jgi:tape measure domain-containing protein
MTTLAELILRADYRQIDEASGSLGGLTQAGGKAASAMKSLAVTLGAAFGVREVMQAAEAYTTISNRLSLVTKSSDELYAAQSDLFEIAQRTRSPLEATAEVYQRLAQNAGALGLSLSEVGDTTETINKLMVISGTSAQSAEAALTQLGQAFASGTLRGEELNSVMEQAPALAMAIAEGMGVTVGELRKLGEQGKITSAAVIEALNQQGAAVDEQFARMAPTIAGATTTIKNSFIEIVGKMDQTVGASSAVASALMGLSEAMDNSIFTEFTRLTVTWGETFSRAADEIDGAGEAIGGVGAAIKAVMGAGWRAFVDMPNNIRTGIKLLTIEITDFVAKGVSGFQTLKEASKAIFTSDTISGALARGDARYKAYEDAYQASTAAILAENANIKAQGEFLARRAELEKLLDGTGILDTKQGSGKGKTTATAEPDKKAEKERAAAEKRAADQQIYWNNQIVAEMDRIAQESEMENAAYEAKRQRLQEQFASEAELENLEYQRKLADYAIYAEMENIAKESQIAYKEKMAKDHENRLLSIDKKSAIEKRTHTQKALTDVAALMNTHSRKLFELGKAAAIANALISARESVVDAFKWGSKLGGPPLAFAFAAAAAAAQAANIASIASTSFGGGGSASSSGGGSAGGAASAPDTSGIASSQQQPVRASVVDIRIQSRGLWRDEDVAELMEAMGERLVDGARFGRVEFVRQ